MKLGCLVLFAVAILSSVSPAQLYGEPLPNSCTVAGGGGPNHDQMIIMLLLSGVGSACSECTSMAIFMAPCGSTDPGMYLGILPVAFGGGLGAGVGFYTVPPAAMNRLCGEQMQFTFVCLSNPACSYSFCTTIQC